MKRKQRSLADSFSYMHVDMKIQLLSLAIIVIYNYVTCRGYKNIQR